MLTNVPGSRTSHDLEAPTEMLSFQHDSMVSESENVLDVSLIALDLETPNLSLSEEDNTTAYTFINHNEFGAYIFIYIISLVFIAALQCLRTQHAVNLQRSHLIVGLSELFLVSGSGVTEDAAHIDVSDTDAVSVISINDNDNDDPKKLLRTLKAKNNERPIVAHININFLNSKFEPLKDIIKDNVDILLVSETKIDDTFPDGQFFIEGYREPIRLDRDRKCHTYYTF